MTLQDHGQSADTSSEHRRGLLITAALSAILVGILGGWLILDSRQSGQGPVQLQEPVQVAGSGSCTLADDTDFTCVYEMSDDRVSGTETFSALPGSVKGNREALEYPSQFILDTDKGQWVGVLARDNMQLFWCGWCDEVHGKWDVTYTGTGAFEGLVYHQQVQGVDPDRPDPSYWIGLPVSYVSVTGTIEPRE